MRSNCCGCLRRATENALIFNTKLKSFGLWFVSLVLRCFFSSLRCVSNAIFVCYSVIEIRLQRERKEEKNNSNEINNGWNCFATVFSSLLPLLATKWTIGSPWDCKTFMLCCIWVIIPRFIVVNMIFFFCFYLTQNISSLSHSREWWFFRSTKSVFSVPQKRKLFSGVDAFDSASANRYATTWYGLSLNRRWATPLDARRRTLRNY